MKARRLPFALALLLAGPLLSGLSVAHAASPYEGRWTENPAWCRNTRASGTDELPITITRRSIETFASSCRVLTSARKGAAWVLRTSCRDEGQTETEPRTRNTVTLRVNGNRLSLRDMNGAQNFTRCPQ
jgi:hypothetical protein